MQYTLTPSIGEDEGVGEGMSESEGESVGESVGVSEGVGEGMGEEKGESVITLLHLLCYVPDILHEGVSAS